MSVKSSFVLCQQRYGVLGSLLYLVVFPFLVRVGTHGLVGWQFGYVSFAPGFPKHIVQVKTFLLKTRYHLNATVFLDHTYKYFSNFICHNNSRVIAYIQLCRTVGMLTRPERWEKLCWHHQKATRLSSLLQKTVCWWDFAFCLSFIDDKVLHLFLWILSYSSLK